MGGCIYGVIIDFFCSNYWVGLYMEFSVGGFVEFYWGDCVFNIDVISDFDSLIYFEDIVCGYVILDFFSLIVCFNIVLMGFICENLNGKIIVCSY